MHSLDVKSLTLETRNQRKKIGNQVFLIKAIRAILPFLSKVKV